MTFQAHVATPITVLCTTGSHGQVTCPREAAHDKAATETTINTRGMTSGTTTAIIYEVPVETACMDTGRGVSNNMVKQSGIISFHCYVHPQEIKLCYCYSCYYYYYYYYCYYYYYYYYCYYYSHPSTHPTWNLIAPIARRTSAKQINIE